MESRQHLPESMQLDTLLPSTVYKTARLDYPVPCRPGHGQDARTASEGTLHESWIAVAASTECCRGGLWILNRGGWEWLYTATLLVLLTHESDPRLSGG